MNTLEAVGQPRAFLAITCSSILYSQTETAHVPDLKSKIATYRATIVTESNKWLLSGRPIPLFFLWSGLKSVPQVIAQLASRNLAGPDSDDSLLAFEYFAGRSALIKQSKKLENALRAAPAKRCAIIVGNSGASLEVVRLALRRNQKLDAVADDRKTTELRTLLDNYHLAAISEGKQRSLLKKSLKGTVEVFLTMLLQRPPARSEIDDVLEHLNT